VAEVTYVINFDAPADRDTYVHRVGRTGRAGATGIGVTFFKEEEAKGAAAHRDRARPRLEARRRRRRCLAIT
jgi:superfamily II DNA/RNA helicase